MGIHHALWEHETQIALVNNLADALHALSTRARNNALVGASSVSPTPNAQIAGYYQAIASPHTHPIVLTFCVLTAMYLFPACRAEVASTTPANYAVYFTGGPSTPPYEVRFEQHLGGSATHQAKTPAEIVVAERQLLMAL